MDSDEVSGDEGGGPRRAALTQKRSRETRRNLVRAAIRLWTERGFERGVEETTVEEIARAAGVTKGTFYFHFAHKEDILLELGLAAAESMHATAEREMAAGRPSVQVLLTLVDAVGAQVSRAPRAAVGRSVTEFYRRPPALFPALDDDRMYSFRRVFTEVLRYGQQRGELPDALRPAEMGGLLEAAVMEGIFRWAAGGRESVDKVLHRYAEVVITGMSGVLSSAEPRTTTPATASAKATRRRSVAEQSNQIHRRAKVSTTKERS